jgi:hypothetical protein
MDEQAINKVKERGGVVVKPPWTDTARKSCKYMTVQCNDGHVWEVRPQNIVNGDSWCKMCYKLKGALVIKAKEAIASHEGAKIIKDVWEDRSIPTRQMIPRITVQCGECDTIWDAQVGNLARGTWCKTCVLANTKPTTTFDDLIKLVTERGGSVVDPEKITYTGARMKVPIKCGFDDHPPFMGYLSAMRMGKWCPSCSTANSVKEEVCRSSMIEAFGDCYSFDRTRKVEWLTSTKANLELDCYEEDLKVACEHQGQQHYEFMPQWHKTQDKFQAQLDRDALKAKLCKDNGVTLIIVPYNIGFKKVRPFIRTELAKLMPSVELLPSVGTEEEFINKVRSGGPATLRRYNEIKRLVEGGPNPKGKVLSTSYVHCSLHMTFKCNNPNHPEFMRTPNYIIKGKFCTMCEDSKMAARTSIPKSRIESHLKPHNLTYLDQVETRYTDSKLDAYFKVQCSHQHLPCWISYAQMAERADYSNIGLKDSPCDQCVELSLNEYPMDRIEAVLKTHPGAFIVKQPWIEGKNSMIKIQCGCSYVWDVRVNALTNANSWCPRCANHIPLSLEDITKRVESHEGAKVLSNIFVDMTDPRQPIRRVKVQCGNGHVWEPNIQFISVNWCNQCRLGKTRPVESKIMYDIVDLHRGTICDDSDVYETCDTKIKINCNMLDHLPFEISTHNMKQGKWCPSCKLSLARVEVCKEALQEISGEVIEKVNGNEFCYLNTRFKVEPFDGSDFKKTTTPKMPVQDVESGGSTSTVIIPYTTHIFDIRAMVRSNVPCLLPPSSITDKEFVENVIQHGSTLHKYFAIKKIVEDPEKPLGKVISPMYKTATINMEFSCINPDHPNFKLTPTSIGKRFCQRCGYKNGAKARVDNKSSGLVVEKLEKVPKISSRLVKDEELTNRVAKHNLTYLFNSRTLKTDKKTVREIEVQCKNLHDPFWVSVNYITRSDFTHKSINCTACQQK